MIYFLECHPSKFSKGFYNECEVTSRGVLVIWVKIRKKIKSKNKQADNNEFFLRGFLI